MSELMKVGITHGDYNGIGYEVSLRALADETITELFTPVFYGIPELVEKAAADFVLTLPPVRFIKRSEEAEDGYLNVVDLGIRPELSIAKFRGDLTERYRWADGPTKMEAVLFTIDSATGLCRKAERVDEWD